MPQAKTTIRIEQRADLEATRVYASKRTVTVGGIYLVTYFLSLLGNI